MNTVVQKVHQLESHRILAIQRILKQLWEADKMNMKKLIESMDHIEECGMTEDPMPTTMPGADAGQPVSMNVSINASGKDHVADLINMMKNAGMSAAEPVGAPSLGMRGDMEKFRSAMDDDPEIPGDDDNPDDIDLRAGLIGALA